MKFKTENGAIVDFHNNLIAYIPGHPSRVDFPWNLIEDLHKKIPGQFRMIHTHPPQMDWYSSIDYQESLYPWAVSMYPFPSRLSVIVPSPGYQHFLPHQIDFVGILEPYEVWKGSGRKRGFEIFEERNQIVYDVPEWYERLMNESYDFS